MPGFSKDAKVGEEIKFYWTSETDAKEKYIIEKEKSKLRNLFERICKKWNISQPPPAILSVIDGSNTGHLKEKYVRILKKGFSNAAESTGAWILTDGKKKGIVKIIGEAVGDYKIKMNEEEEKLKHENNDIVDIDKRTRSKILLIGFSNILDKKDLDENHNHVKTKVLNPTEADKNRKSDSHNITVARHLKWEFEKFMSKQEWSQYGDQPNSFRTVPVVRVMFEGDIESLKYMVKSVKEKIPVLVLKGSGGASDFIGYEHEKIANATSKDSNLYETAAAHFGLQPDNMKVYETVFADLQDILTAENKMVYVYYVEDKKKTLDRCLHEIMFQEFKANLDIKDQLDHVQTWNRCDIAEADIFTLVNKSRIAGMKEKNPHIFDELLKDALIEDMRDFSILYLDHISDIKLFVQRHLKELFTRCIEMDTAGHLFDHRMKTNGLDTSSLEDIGRGIERLFDNGSFNPFRKYTTDKKSKRYDSDAIAYRDLFIWALVFNRTDLAKAFWERNSDNICAALYASSLLNALAEVAASEGNIELSLSYMEDSRYFERLSCDVMSALYHTNHEAAHDILSKKIKLYGSTTNFELADTNILMEFMEHTACQSKINIIWKGRIAPYTPYWKIFVSCVFPVLLVTTRFLDIQSSKRNETDIPWHKFRRKIWDLFHFFEAPIVKFVYHLILYLVFLCIFSVFVLSDLYEFPDTGPIIFETFIGFWISTMFVEELRQVYSGEHDSFLRNLKSWFSSVWNKFDLMTYTLFYTTVVLRLALPDNNFYYARMFYAITLAMFFLRSLQFFLVAKYFGPKVIMLGRMAADTIFFILIFTVFVFSFGIMYQSTLFPNTPVSWQLVLDIVYLPYWQLYGELFIDHIEGKEPSECSRDPVLISNGTLPRCAESHPGNSLFLAVYLVITNVLLLNVLIAMFSNTFNKVQENSALVWKFYRYGLVQEYCERPMLAPPLIIFAHLYRFYFFLTEKCKGKGPNSQTSDNASSKPKRLEIIEQEAVDNYDNPMFHRYKMRKDIDIGDRKSRYKQESEITVRQHLKNLSEEVKGIQRRLELICEDTTTIKKEKQSLLVVDVPRQTEPVHVTNYQKTKRQRKQT